MAGRIFSWQSTLKSPCTMRVKLLIGGASTGDGGVMSGQVARLLALSYGETTLGRERWDQMRAMEHVRMERLRLHVTRVSAV